MDHAPDSHFYINVWLSWMWMVHSVCSLVDHPYKDLWWIFKWDIQCDHSWITCTKTYSEFLNGSFGCSVTQHFNTTHRLGCCPPPPQYSFHVDYISEIRIPCSKYSWIVMIQTVVVRWATPQTLHRHSPATPIWFLLLCHLSSIKSAVSMFNWCLVPRCFQQLYCKPMYKPSATYVNLNIPWCRDDVVGQTIWIQLWPAFQLSMLDV